MGLGQCQPMDGTKGSSKPEAPAFPVEFFQALRGDVRPAMNQEAPPLLSLWAPATSHRKAARSWTPKELPAVHSWPRAWPNCAPRHRHPDAPAPGPAKRQARRKWDRDRPPTPSTATLFPRSKGLASVAWQFGAEDMGSLPTLQRNA